MSTTDRVAALLIEHGRDDIKGCRCGWGELGKSHPEHVARVLTDAGLIANRRHDERIRQETRQPLVDALYKVWQYAGELESEVARCEPAYLQVSAEGVFERLLKTLPNLGREFIERERAERDARIEAQR